MAYWVREIAGWLLVIGGLWLIGVVIEFCQNRWILEAAIVGIVAVFVFRGGIHLLKVAIAARICQEAWARSQNRPRPGKLTVGGPPATGDGPRSAGFSPRRDLA